MKNLYLFTIFENDGGRPRCTGVLAGNQVQIFDFYRPGSRTLIKVVNDNKAKVARLITEASDKNISIVTNDFKSHVKAFNLPRRASRPDGSPYYNVYDLAILPDIKPSETLSKDTEIIKKVLERMTKTKLKEWNRVFANAGVVYQAIEDRGLWCNYVRENPVWSQKVFSGRSKTSGFNIQGFKEPYYVIQPGASEKEVVLHFDWISADIRVAALLSGDKRLEDAFISSDPYTYMMAEVNANSNKTLGREECKKLLLQSINSMDFTSIALTSIYPQLGDWIGRCKKITSEDGGYLETILGRRFRVAHAKNALAVLNGVQQGSVAHAMQNVIRRVWARFGERLLMEGHDSLVVSSPATNEEAMATLRAVSEIMLYPFEGLLPSNPAFPLKVSIGKKWRKWKLKAIVRPTGIQYVRPEEARDQEESSDPQEEAEGGEAGTSEGSGEEAGGDDQAGDPE
jgi:hypothetical protein